jgi:hypothetical protein
MEQFEREERCAHTMIVKSNIANNGVCIILIAMLNCELWHCAYPNRYQLVDTKRVPRNQQ